MERTKRLRRWDFDREEYLPYDVPADGKITTYAPDMDTKINCASCGKEITVGDSYTSRTIHTGMGFGYLVCGECYEKDWEEQRRCYKRMRAERSI